MRPFGVADAGVKGASGVVDRHGVRTDTELVVSRRSADAEP